MKLTELLNLDELELAEAMTGPEFYNKLTSPEFKSKDTFNVTVPFKIDNKKVDLQIPITLEMGNLDQQVEQYLKATPELKKKFDTYAYWYDNFNKLVVNRPTAICSDCAVYNESDLTVAFDIANNYDLLSGISIHIDTHRHAVNANKTIINVKTITLTDLLDKYEAPSFIEYLSIDTEGSEYEILKAFNFEKYTFGLIDVEHNYIQPRRSQIRELLLSKGYVFIRQNSWDDCYKHGSLA